METATRDAFIDMFDGDDQLEYEPASTAAIILAGGDEDAEKAAMLVRPAAWQCYLYSACQNPGGCVSHVDRWSALQHVSSDIFCM